MMVKINIEKGDAFVKTNGIDSIWIVDKILDFDEVPVHVRLIEQGGNNRTATVALSVLLNTKMWKPADKDEH